MFLASLDISRHHLTHSPPCRRTVYYISALMAFYKNSRMIGDKDALQQRLTRIPTLVLDGLISRFSETERSTNKHVSVPPSSFPSRLLATRPKMTPQTEALLLTHMFALCLRVEDYASDTESIAHDLSMPPAK